METDNPTKTPPITIQHFIPRGRKNSSENALYRPRRPQDSSYYHCVEDHFEDFERVYEERFERAYGFYRPYLRSAMEKLARYIIRASFSQERMTYLPEESKVIYESRDGKKEKVFDALEWLAAMSSHVPDKGEQMVRYYGYYSNVSRGKRKKLNQDEWIPCILESEGSSKEYRKNWARLIQKIYEVDPLTCPKCQGRMKIIAFIEDEEVVEKILKHLRLWYLKARPPPIAKTPSVTMYLDNSDSQISSPDAFYADPDYPIDSYVS